MKMKSALCGLTMILSAFGCSAQVKKTPKPNILVILCDDLGYADVGFNNSPDIITPELDKLAKAGTIMTSAYVAHPFCGPSRAALMTGRYPHQIGAPYNLSDNGRVTDLGVPVNEIYMSNMLQGAGYYTSIVGKWHLGDNPQFRPNKRGFDEFFGFLGGGHRYFPNQYQPIYEKQKSAGMYPINDYLKPLMHNNEEVSETEYVTDALSREAVRIVTESKKKNKPFFMYLSYNAPHVPLEAKEEDLKVFANIKDKDRRTYAAMVYAVDRGVGEIVKRLKENGQYENTLIVFFSDNGGNFDHGANNFPLKGTKGDTFEGGFRVPMFFHWPNKIAAGVHFDHPVSALDLYPTFAHLANTNPPKGKVLNGKNIWNDLASNTSPHKDEMIYSLRYREGYCDVAARKEDWKIVRMGNEPWQLFNITKDLGEHKDLSGQFPDRLKEMVAETKEWTKTHIAPLWVYSQKDAEYWESGRLPGYDDTFEVDKLRMGPLEYKEMMEKRK
ncbi:sulfatase-like hydrolase/transferase [Flavobacterium sp. NG2]|uniref:sulfatase family protein n=1 Tax=Flavobacterium sp. NG2 TaxID=3097547 RepID=UPI002A82AB9E|nr:sulfatase-like hydrolase/transferase [Flavobacterium sp. NG2]WPR72988.1 sulfatase-like hydrolase/transferase [Flavobacterium sp. NG2]